MAISKSDIKRDIVKGQCVVYLVHYEAKSDSHGVPNAGFFHNLPSIPPIGPPISVL